MSNHNQNQQIAEDDVIDLKELFFSLLQHWYIILVAMLVTLLLALVYLKRTLPVYSANAMLQVESKSASSDLLLGDLAGFDGKSEVQTEIEIIKSRMILGEVAKNLNLDIGFSLANQNAFSKFFKKKALAISNDDMGVYFNRDEDTDTLHISQFKVSDSLVDKRFKLTVVDNENYHLALLKDDAVLQTFKGVNGKVLDASADVGAVVLKLVYDGLADYEFYLQKNGELIATSRAGGGLSASEKGKRTGILELTYQGVDKQKITDTLNEVVDIYVAKNLAKKTAEKEKTLEFLDEQLPQIKADLELAESKFNAFRNKNDTVDVTKEAQLLLEQSVQLGRTKLELEQKRAELSARFTDEYPLLKQVDLQLNTLKKKMGEVSGRLKSLPGIQQEYLKLYRDVEINTQLYTNLLNNFQKLKIAKSGEIGNVRVIDKAVKPIKPIKPKKMLVLLLSLVLGGMLGVGLVLLKKLLSSGVKNASHIETQTGLPVLANIPRSEIQRGFFKNLDRKKRLHNLLYVEEPEDMAIEALRSLRTSLHFSLKSAKNNIIMITGPSPGIGKSFISANFAAVLASAGKNVVIIDGDLRRGHIHKYYGQKNQQGLAGYILGENTDTPVRQSMVKHLSFIPRGKSPSNPAEILMSERFQNLLKSLAADNDFVIIDSPPTLAVTDSSVIGGMAGSALVVARYGVSDLKEIQLTVDRLKAGGSNVVGFVFNDVQKEAGNTYGYQYGYGYKSE